MLNSSVSELSHSDVLTAQHVFFFFPLQTCFLILMSKERECVLDQPKCKASENVQWQLYIYNTEHNGYIQGIHCIFGVFFFFFKAVRD